MQEVHPAGAWADPELSAAFPTQAGENVFAFTVRSRPPPYLVMALISGQSLQQRIDRDGPSEPCDPRRLERWPNRQGVPKVEDLSQEVLLSVALTIQSATQQVTALQAQVTALRTAGVLSKDQA